MVAELNNPRFINGGLSDPNNPYPGIRVNTFQEGLELIRDTWTQAGAITYVDDIANNLLVVQFQTTTNDILYARFSKQIPGTLKSPDHVRILVQLDIDGTGTHLSPETWESVFNTTNLPVGTHSMGLDFSENGGTIWGGFDNDACAIATRDLLGHYDSIGLGFLDRIYPDEIPLSATISKVDWRLLNCYFATHPLKQGYWHNAGDDFDNPDYLSSPNCGGGYKKLFDEIAICNPKNNFLNNSAGNPAYLSHRGKKNLFDKYLVSKDCAYFLAFPYDPSSPNSLDPFLLGWEKFRIRGVASAPPGSRIPSAQNNNEWYLVCGSGNPIYAAEDGNQGIIIAQ